MKQHISQDTLLKLALETLEPPAELRVRSHLDGCSRCRNILEGIEASLGTIAGVKPVLPMDPPLLPFARPVSSFWLRAAAILVVGFGLGFLASESRRTPPVAVVQQQLVPRSPDVPRAAFISCDEVDLSVRVR